MPRFVILEHDYPELHWDLMLESDGMLQTWRLALLPEVTGEPIAATPLPDHRLHYLDYEGPVSGGRGTVKRWDRGEYERVASASGLRVQLRGQRLQAHAAIDFSTVRFIN